MAYEGIEGSGIEHGGTGVADNRRSWTAPLWIGAYLVLTGGFLLAGVFLTLSVLSVMSPGIGTMFVVFGLGIGSAAFAPTGAKLVLIATRSRFDARNGSTGDTAVVEADPEGTPR